MIRDKKTLIERSGEILRKAIEFFDVFFESMQYIDLKMDAYS